MRKLIPAILLSLISASASAQALNGTPTAHAPYSRTAMAITGPIIISDKSLIFSNGKSTALEVVGVEVVAEWGLSGEVVPAQILKLQSDPGELVNGNSLCGGGEMATYLVAFTQKGFTSWLLEIAIFSGDVAPASINSAGLCGTYNYETDAR